VPLMTKKNRSFKTWL